MKAYILMINWVLSLCALSVDTDTAPLKAVLAIVAWFTVSTILLIRAGKKGVFKNIEKRFKMEEL